MNPKLKRRLRRTGITLAVLFILYFLMAYAVLPAYWRHYEHNPGLEEVPKTTVKAWGKPGDPLNVSLIGTEEEIVQAMIRAGWQPASRKTLRAVLRIAESGLLKRPYSNAPVSNLYLWGRRQDLAFEQVLSKGPGKRHHVRFWQAGPPGQVGKPLWIGAVTFDRSVGFSRLTGEITHHIAPDVDAERDNLMADLQRAGQLIKIYQVTGVGATLRATNGEGDWYYTDGELTVGVLSPDNMVQTTPPVELASPKKITAKKSIWKSLAGLLKFFEKF
jgi:hypothetical protein